jgi:hypothetical protein
MNNYEETFERLANRGAPIGAVVLLERVEYGLSDHVDSAPPRRRLRGVAVAVAAFGGVLVLGLVWVLVGSPTDFIGGPDKPVIEWIEELGNQDGLPVQLTAGPGGILRWSPFPGAGDAGVGFSADGRTWSVVDLSVLDPGAFVQSVTATGDRWMLSVLGGDGTTATWWMSPDGLDWTPVVWPDSLGDTISGIVRSGEGFLAVSRDVFGAGTTLWWSEDGEQWAESAGGGPADLQRVDLRGTSGGMVLIPHQTDDTTQTIYHSIDGTTWVEGRVELPAEFTAGPTRWGFGGVVDHVGGMWIAVGEVFRTDADPVLFVWTSPDGVEWTPQGIPEFGRMDGVAASVGEHAVIGDYLVVAPARVPLYVGDDGIVSGAGSVVPTGELWATQDGRSWQRVLRTGADITAIAGTVTESGTTVGVWMARPTSDSDQPSVATTAGPVAPQELDQAGLDLQAEILADGVVTEAELEQALEGWKACMEERGLLGVSFEIDPQQGWTGGYGSLSPDPSAGEAEDAACRQSYLNQVEDALAQ